MSIMPALSALRRHTTAVTLIGLQIALTLAIISNFSSIVQQRLAYIDRPTGIAEANLFVIQNQWLGSAETIGPRLEADLAAIRSTPGVVDAYVTNSVPLLGRGSSGPIYLGPQAWQQKQAQAGSADEYYSDEHGLKTLGVNLLRGRWLVHEDVENFDDRSLDHPSNVVITQHLADDLFPGQDALGRLIYHPGLYNPPNRVVGIVARAQTNWAFQSGQIARSLADDSIFMPYRSLSKEILYVVRARDGALATAMRTSQERMYSVSQDRIIESARTFAQIRKDAYRSLRWSVIPLAAVCILMLFVAVAGVIGLNMYWVSQRRRYIGMRRALGARRVDILRFVQMENLLISGSACIIGVACGLAMNVWLASIAEVTRMSVGYISIGALLVVILCQAASFWPAIRASLIPPATASRGL